MASYIIDATNAWSNGITSVETSATINTLVRSEYMAYATRNAVWRHTPINRTSDVRISGF